MRDITERQRQRKVYDRKIFLVNELIRLDKHINQDKPLSSFSLAELEQMHINEKCRSSHVFAYLNGVRI